jgi:N-acetylglucosamine kinase-like BadF-type ATPase
LAVVDFAVAVDGGGTGADVVVAVVVVVLKQSSAALAFAVLPTVDRIGGKAPVHMSEAVEGCKELANAVVVLALTLVLTTWKLEEAVAVLPSSHPQNYDDQVDAAVSLVGCHVVGWLG